VAVRQPHASCRAGRAEGGAAARRRCPAHCGGWDC
jgi:hypothetical protein